MTPNNKLFAQALALHQRGDISGAESIYLKILRLHPKDPDLLHLIGVASFQKEDYRNAVEFIQKAIKINPSFAAAYSNMGLALKELKQLDAAVASYDRAIALQPNYPDAYINRGNARQQLKQLDAAMSDYDRAIALQPGHFGAYLNRGNALQEMKQMEAAIASYDRALALKPDCVDAHVNRGNALRELRQAAAAAASYDRALALQPAYAFLPGTFLHEKMKICDWQGYEENVKNIIDGVRNGRKMSPPFPLLAFSDDSSLHRKASEIWVGSKYINSLSVDLVAPNSGGEKIRIGYFSADFHNHATAYLMAELFECHDRSKFEIFAFSLGPDQQDEMRQRISAAFDAFIDVSRESDAGIAKISRDSGIDIAIDLKGYTGDSRPGIFWERCAPLQVSYIGYPGTMGSDRIDYLIADKTVISKGNEVNFSEKIIYLPNSYQVNDAQRNISDRIFSRGELALPDHGFVFCCFNNACKITPSIFDGWMRVVSQIEGSVLWLLEEGPALIDNLRREAESRGIDGDRLIFAKRMNLPDHLARCRVADLFLDTLPYNAHTTASDALWAGLPVLTCMGQSFASRVAGSLLTALELPELITDSSAAYESKAIELARYPAQLAEIRNKLERNRQTSSLFDARLFARHIEAAFTEIHRRRLAGLPPASLDIDP